MRYLLDTNVVGDARAKRSPSLMAWLKNQVISDLAISVVTVLELERGVRRKERKDPAGAASLRLWLNEDVRAVFAGRVLSVDEPTAIAAAALHLPDPRPETDALIAATAIVHDLTLVTHNVTDFQSAGIRVLDPGET